MIKDIKTKEIFEFREEGENCGPEVQIFLEIDYINKCYSLKNRNQIKYSTFIFENTKNFEWNIKLLNLMKIAILKAELILSKI